MNEYDFNGRVFVPANLKSNKKSIIGKLDLRDILFVSVGAGIFAIVFFTLNKIVPNNIAFPVAMLCSGPILIVGFIKIDDLKIEEYLIVMRANKLLSSRVRINNSDNLYEVLERKKKQALTKKNGKTKGKNINIFELFKFDKKIKKRRKRRKRKKVA